MLLSGDDFEMESNTFAAIAAQHNDKLFKLRENFELFSQQIDQKFDEIMKKLRQWSGYGEEDRLQFQDTTSFRTSEQEGSIMSANTSDIKRIPPESIIDREGGNNMRLESQGSL